MMMMIDLRYADLNSKGSGSFDVSVCCCNERVGVLNVECLDTK